MVQGVWYNLISKNKYLKYIKGCITVKKIDEFINCYSLSKTLRFSLIPMGKTEETFTEKLLLEEDENRAKEYGTVIVFETEVL